MKEAVGYISVMGAENNADGRYMQPSVPRHRGKRISKLFTDLGDLLVEPGEILFLLRPIRMLRDQGGDCGTASGWKCPESFMKKSLPETTTRARAFSVLNHNYETVI